MPARLNSYSPPGVYGYTVKAWIAREIEARHFGKTYFVWFSRRLNPLENGLSSNPHDLYRVLDTAVKRDDRNNAKIKDLRAKLLNVVAERFSDATLRQEVEAAIDNADLTMFSPQVWRIDLSKITPERIQRGRPGWDEALITNLRDDEFTVIVP